MEVLMGSPRLITRRYASFFGCLRTIKKNNWPTPARAETNTWIGHSLVHCRIVYSDPQTGKIKYSLLHINNYYRNTVGLTEYIKCVYCNQLNWRCNVNSVEPIRHPTRTNLHQSVFKIVVGWGPQRRSNFLDVRVSATKNNNNLKHEAFEGTVLSP